MSKVKVTMENGKDFIIELYPKFFVPPHFIF